MKCDGENETTSVKELTEEERKKLDFQNSRLVSSWKADKLEANIKKHWDLFYKRNENRFFKDRHWTTREFSVLADLQKSPKGSDRHILLEVGCGAGNLVYPLLEEGLPLEVWAVDISPRALTLLEQHPLYSRDRVHTLCADVSQPGGLAEIGEGTVDVCTLVFVLSAIHPSKYRTVAHSLHTALRPGGSLLLRDYGLYDMTQIRFGPGHKIANNLYMRQDGTRSYFFKLEEIEDIFTNVGFQKVTNNYIHRRTINKKEGIDVPRVFVQAKFIKKQPAADGEVVDAETSNLA